MPPAGERVDAHDRVVLVPQSLARIQQWISIGVGNQALDARAPQYIAAPILPLVLLAHRCVHGLPVIARNRLLSGAMKLCDRAHQVPHE